MTLLPVAIYNYNYNYNSTNSKSVDKMKNAEFLSK